MKKYENTIVGAPPAMTKERAEYEQVLAALAQHSVRVSGAFNQLLQETSATGLAVTILPVPRQPLAMGNYDLELTVYPSRALYQMLDELEEAAEKSEAPALNEDCANGVHSWMAEPGRLASDAKCAHCGEEYGDPH